jgi:hypothetical protein
VRIALVDTNKKSKLYPVALLKLGAWCKDRGDECKIFYNELPEADTYDEAWLTTAFTYQVSHVRGIISEAKKRFNRVWVGGISATLVPEQYESMEVEVHRGLHADAEKYAPDYSLLNENAKYSICHITRGCVRKCGFCYVKVIEPKFKHRDNWPNDILKTTNKILFYDNNWLACNANTIKKDADTIKAILKTTSNKSVDFNQALDCRLLTEEKADAMAGIKFDPLRFAFDGMHEDGYIQDAIKLMAERGQKKFSVYLLYNFKDTPEDTYYRMREMVRLNEEIAEGGKTIEIFPMRYQPILGDRDYVGEHWQKIQVKAIPTIIAMASCRGQLSFKPSGRVLHGLREYEYFFGKNVDEFIKLTKYPKLRLLTSRKQMNLRMLRSKELSREKSSHGNTAVR